MLLSARGGFYNSPEANVIELATNYMRVVVPNYLDFQIAAEVVIEGHVQDHANAGTIIGEGLEKVKQLAKTL